MNPKFPLAIGVNIVYHGIVVEKVFGRIIHSTSLNVRKEEGNVFSIKAL